MLGNLQPTPLPRVLRGVNLAAHCHYDVGNLP